MSDTLKAQDISGILDDIRRHGGAHEADSLARAMLAAAFAHFKVHHGARRCVVIADRLAQDFCDDVLGHRNMGHKP